MTAKDDNGMPLLYGVSHLDGKTPVRISFGANRRMGTDIVTSIAFDPALVAGQQTANDVPVAKGTSSADDMTVLPWVVNAFNGKVLIDQ